MKVENLVKIIGSDFYTGVPDSQLKALCNYLMHMLIFNVFLWLGLSRELAPIAVLAIAVPVNFLLVRFVFKHFKTNDGTTE